MLPGFSFLKAYQSIHFKSIFMASMTYHIQNMKCEGCCTQIKGKLSKIKGIKNIKLDVKENTISFTYTRMEALDQVKQILLKMGYPLSDNPNSFASISKSYLSCMIGKTKNAALE